MVGGWIYGRSGVLAELQTAPTVVVIQLWHRYSSVVPLWFAPHLCGLLQRSSIFIDLVVENSPLDAALAEWPSVPSLRWVLWLMTLICLLGVAQLSFSGHLANKLGSQRMLAPLTPHHTFAMVLQELPVQKSGSTQYGAVSAPDFHAAQPQAEPGVDPPEPLKPEPDSDPPEGTRMQGALLMLAVAVLWGSNFPAVKATIEAGVPASMAAALRFSVQPRISPLPPVGALSRYEDDDR